MVAFATSATPVDREGWLNKRGEVNRGYQRRWFVLKGNILFYFDRRGDKEPVGMIVLEGCTIELAEDEEQFGFKIVFHGPNNRSYALGAESQANILLLLFYTVTFYFYFDIFSSANQINYTIYN